MAANENITLEAGTVFGLLIGDRVAKCTVNHVSTSDKSPEPPKVNQCDIAWGAQSLTPEINLTICQVGCRACSLFSQYLMWGGEYDLRTFLDVLYDHGAFSGGYLSNPAAASEAVDVLHWGRVVVGEHQYHPYYNWHNGPAWIGLLKTVLDHQPLIVQLDYDPKDRDIDSHFVLAYQYLPPTLPGDVDDDLLIMDPLGGKYRRVSHYFNPDWLRDGSMPEGVTKVSRIVTGARIWTRAQSSA
jgi:hypothetical protein